MPRFIFLVCGAILFLAEVGLADTVILKNGDILRGKVSNPVFGMKSPYGAFSINAAMLKGIFARASEMGNDEVQTINNDYFSGRLSTPVIELSTTAGHRFDLKLVDIRTIQFDRGGVTREIDTALFFMHNGDKFSGRLMNAEVRVHTDYAEKTFRRDALARIGFTKSGGNSAVLQLKNGSQFKGALLAERFSIHPDSLDAISVCVASVDRIQFNVKRLIASPVDTAGAVLDQDSDGVPDAHDECPDTACGFVTDQTGCRPLSDTDHDGVADGIDRCPGTPAGAQTDLNGCWVIRAALFDLDRSVLSPDSHKYLDEVVWILERNPSMRVEVQGHADQSGSADYNVRLTQARANSVVAYLVGQGIDRNRLTAVGYGFSRPKASNDTEAGRALNRRVELVPISK